MFRVKYIFLLILPLLFSSCPCFHSSEPFTTELDKKIYGLSENIVLSYTFNGYNGNNILDGKTYGEIVLTIDKKIPSETGDILEKKSFQVIDAGNLTKRYEDDTLYVRLFNNSEGVPLDKKIVMSIDEPGRYRILFYCYIQPEEYNYDGHYILAANCTFDFTVQEF